MTTWLEFEALDVWFFRDGRPFTAGEAHWVQSQFPPPPATVLGAARAVLLESFFTKERAAGTDVHLNDYGHWLRTKKDRPPEVLKAYEQAQDDYGIGTTTGRAFTLCGPFIVAPSRYASNLEPMFVAPRDLVATPLRPDKQEWGRTTRLLEPLAVPIGDARWNGVANTPNTLCPSPLVAREMGDENLEEIGWIPFNSFTTYLLDMSGAVVVQPPETREPRTGIALESSTRTARESHLYRVDFARPRVERWKTVAAGGEARRTHILAGVPDLKDAQGDWWLPFGGEGRVARARRAALSPTDPAGQVVALLDPGGTIAAGVLKKSQETGSRWLRVVLLQPAVFKRGWLPDDIDASNGTLVVAGHHFALRSAAVGKPQLISGWDLATNGPKPLVRAVPAGSVFHFEYIGPADKSTEALQAFIHAQHGQGALQDDAMIRSAGYGLAVVGACTPVMGNSSGVVKEDGNV